MFSPRLFPPKKCKVTIMEIIVILIIIVISVAVEAALYTSRGGKKLSYSARLERQEVFEGESVTLTEELNNGKALPLPFVKSEIIAPSCIDFGIGAKTSKEDLCYIPSIFSLKGNQRCTRTRQLKCTQRGNFEIGSTSLYGGDLFGIGHFTLFTENREKLTVLPTPLLAEDFYPNSKMLHGDIQVRRFICEDPFLISGAHEYSGREPMNSIFWNGTARTGKLMALNKDFTTCSQTLIMLNFQRRDDIIAAEGNAACELLIKAAAFAVEECEQIKGEYALAVNIPESEGEALIPKSGETYKTELLRKLARLRIDCKQTLMGFMESLPLDGFTDLILITPTLSQKTADYLNKRKNNGQGVFVYSPKNDSDADFFVQITRKAAGEA